MALFVIVTALVGFALYAFGWWFMRQIEYSLWVAMLGLFPADMANPGVALAHSLITHLPEIYLVALLIWVYINSQKPEVGYV